MKKMIQRKKARLTWNDRVRLKKLKGEQVALSDFQPKTEQIKEPEQKTVPQVPQETKVSVSNIYIPEDNDKLDVNGQPKLKSKAEIRKAIKINAQVQVLNGEHCIRFKNVPTILLDMKPPTDYHKDAKQNFAMWFKLEDKEYMSVVKQLKPHLRELTFWFNPEDEKKLSSFLNNTDDSDFDEIETNRDPETGRMVM